MDLASLKSLEPFADEGKSQAHRLGSRPQCSLGGWFAFRNDFADRKSIGQHED